MLSEIFYGKKMTLDRIIDKLRPISKGVYIVKYSNNTSCEFKYTDGHYDIPEHFLEADKYARKAFGINIIEIIKLK